jgi:hypothetical protein
MRGIVVKHGFIEGSAMAASSTLLRTQSLDQEREPVSPSRPPTFLQLVCDAANLCTLLAVLFDLFAISVTLRDKNIHLAIALGQLSAM